MWIYKTLLRDIRVLTKTHTHVCLQFLSLGIFIARLLTPAMDTDTTQSEVVCLTAAAVAQENFQRTWPRCMRIEDLAVHAYRGPTQPPRGLRRGAVG